MHVGRAVRVVTPWASLAMGRSEFLTPGPSLVLVLGSPGCGALGAPAGSKGPHPETCGPTVGLGIGIFLLVQADFVGGPIRTLIKHSYIGGIVYTLGAQKSSHFIGRGHILRPANVQVTSLLWCTTCAGVCVGVSYSWFFR